MKKILLIIALLLFTGCTAEYNLNFYEDTVEEKITVIPTTSEEQENTQYLENRDFYAIIDQEKSFLYERKQEKQENFDINEYSYKYKFDEFKQSRFTTCYDAYTLIDENNIVTLSTSKKFNCMIYDYMPIDNLKINITTEYKVIENNADEVNGNTYTWNINNENASNKPIKISYNKKQKRKLTLKEFIEKNKTNLILLAGLLALFIIITLSIMIKHKRVNKI